MKHSVCRWCYSDISLDKLCEFARSIGIASIDLLEPGEMATAKQYGLTCAMISNPTVVAADGNIAGRIELAWNRPEYHETLQETYAEHLKQAAAAGATNVICFSGNRDSMDDQTGLQNCAKGLSQLMPLVEELDLTLTMELLNSKVDHPDYMCDHTAWGVELCEAIGSDRFKLLYDIYHMQIMEGDVIATIRRFHPYISHYHTGGVPGRNEIDETQELYYPAIIQAIRETGYEGFIAQEFVPVSQNPLESLRRAIEICS